MVTSAHTSAHGLYRHAVARGIPAATVSGWLGVAACELGRPGRLPAARLLDTWQLVRAELGDVAVAARAVRDWTLADYGLIGFYLAASPTMRDAFAAIASGSRLITERGSWHVVDADDTLRCVWSWAGPHTPDHALANEVMVAGVVRGIRELGAGSPVRAEFMHRAPPARTEYESLLECDVRFGRPETAVVFPRAWLDAVPRSANPALHRFLGGLVAGELAALAPPTLRARVHRVLALGLRADAASPAVADVARNLGMSERTLRRRLADERLSFRALRQTAQLERAAELLASSDGSLGEIALACGFADASAFGRAWRRSHGEAPSRSRGRR